MRGRLVSVVIPVFNGAEFITEAIASVLAQDYEPVEIIVIDDGSTDGSAEIAASFQDVLLIRRDNAGPATARNAGLDAAGGDFIAFLDADDLMLPHKLSTQIGFLMDHPGCGCVLAHHEVVAVSGAEPPGWMEASFGAARSEVQVLSAVLRREVLERVGRFDTSLSVSEDFDLLVRIRAGGIEIATLTDVLTRRRMHGANISYRVKDIQKEMLKSVRSRMASRRALSDDTDA